MMAGQSLQILQPTRPTRNFDENDIKISCNTNISSTFEHEASRLFNELPPPCQNCTTSKASAKKPKNTFRQGISERSCVRLFFVCFYFIYLFIFVLFHYLLLKHSSFISLSKVIGHNFFLVVFNRFWQCTVFNFAFSFVLSF